MMREKTGLFKKSCLFLFTTLEQLQQGRKQLREGERERMLENVTLLPGFFEKGAKREKIRTRKKVQMGKKAKL